ncbi:MAG: M20/M25/M40 family metallo-hydrolase, partial [Actinobacteria bacterium]|nr:M20/M25/M40 family metallo-hydrolase [Actinomycetota bacterium]
MNEKLNKNGSEKKGENSSIFISLINESRLMQRFIDILRIKSPSKSEKEIVDYLFDKFSKLGVSLSVDDAGKKLGGNTGNLTGYFKSINSQEAYYPIFLCAHLDTVVLNGEVLPVIKDGRVINENSLCILGGDDKVAIAAILEALEVIRENDIKTADLYLIFTVQEEIAVLGARHLDLDKIKAKYGFVFDGEGDIGDIFNEAPYHNTFDIEITGRPAHSGIEPEKGINSIKAAADAIAKLNPGRVDSRTTFNIAMINGGTATNIVPEKTRVKAEARSLDVSELEKVSDLII